MTDLAMDIADAEQRARYPEHGWAVNSQGQRLLWFPLLHLVENVQVFRQQRGIESPISAGAMGERKFLVDTLKKYVRALRELHRVGRHARDYSIDFDSSAFRSQEASTARTHAAEMGPLFIDLALIYLRRLADRITVATAPVLFESFESAPREYKNLIGSVKANRIDGFKPICDVCKLRKAVEEHSSWFSALRGTNADGKKGLRDAVEHRGVILWPHLTQIGNSRPTYEVTMFSRSRDVMPVGNVLDSIAEHNSGLCAFMSALCDAAGWRGSYGARDVFLVVGDEEDVTALWPQL